MSTKLLQQIIFGTLSSVSLSIFIVHVLKVSGIEISEWMPAILSFGLFTFTIAISKGNNSD